MRVLDVDQIEDVYIFSPECCALNWQNGRSGGDAFRHMSMPHCCFSLELKLHQQCLRTCKALQAIRRRNGLQSVRRLGAATATRSAPCHHFACLADARGPVNSRIGHKRMRVRDVDQREDVHIFSPECCALNWQIGRSGGDTFRHMSMPHCYFSLKLKLRQQCLPTCKALQAIRRRNGLQSGATCADLVQLPLRDRHLVTNLHASLMRAAQ
jgi:hypothetical protein